jgi:hypothetical protein
MATRNDLVTKAELDAEGGELPPGLQQHWRSLPSYVCQRSAQWLPTLRLRAKHRIVKPYERA